MRICTRVFWVPKEGNSPEEYEDAFWPNRAIEREGSRLRCAVADGATEASFSGIWARMVVRAYCQGKLGPRHLPASLPRLQMQWHALVQARSEHLPWYVQEKLRYGAFTTLLGLTVKGAHPSAARVGTWEAMAIGDSCLFHVRGKELLAAFPLEHVDQFTNRPLLLPSNSERNANIVAGMQYGAGHWRIGDVIYLMTDALALWFLRRHYEERTAIVCLSDINTQLRFAELIGEERYLVDTDGRPYLRNDDVTLLCVNLCE